MNKEHKRGLRGKGFYIILFLCAAAIGVSSYVIFTGDKEKLPEAAGVELHETQTEQTTSEPTTRDKSTEKELSLPKTPTNAGVKKENTTEAAAEPYWLRPVSGAVSRSFSGDTLVYSSTLGDWRTHNGTDFVCPVGTEVKAIGKGVVTEVSAEGISGMTVKVEHAGGYTAVYANLDENAMCKVGDEVNAGDVIGKVGKTMLSEIGEQEHLHLEVLKSSQYIDPMSLFAE